VISQYTSSMIHSTLSIMLVTIQTITIAVKLVIVLVSFATSVLALTISFLANFFNRPKETRKCQTFFYKFLLFENENEGCVTWAINEPTEVNISIPVYSIKGLDKCDLG
jgi:hypothetical protein